MKHLIKIIVFLIVIFIASFLTLRVLQTKKDMIQQRAEDAYIYFYPLVQMGVLKNEFTSKFAPVNKFKHFRTLFTDKDREVVTPNNDTLYSTAWLDLKKEPIILHVPNTQGRYYVMQLNDAYTNNFANIGARSTGTTEKDFALVGPNFKGDLPDNLEIIHCPTNIIWLLGRILTDKSEDIARATKLQDQFKLIPFSEYIIDKTGNNDYGNWVAHDPIVLDFQKNPYTFWEKAVSMIKDNPTPKDQIQDFNKFKILGITQQGFKPELLSVQAKKSMRKAVLNGPTELKIMLQKMQANFNNINNWEVNTETIGTYGKNYKDRAIIALGYIGALVPQEAIYPICKRDKYGNILRGTNKYTIHFEKDKLPPTKAFWSITIYNSKDFFLVKNPIDRYSIGNRTRGLEKNKDGSLTIYIQNEKPTNPKELANWLPAQGLRI